jgi:archaellum component FlaC
LVTVDQLFSWNKIWEQYKDLDKIVFEISKFWNNLRLFKERWEAIYKKIKSNNEAIEKFDKSVKKVVDGGEEIKNREKPLLEKLSESSEEK